MSSNTVKDTSQRISALMAAAFFVFIFVVLLHAVIKQPDGICADGNTAENGQCQSVTLGDGSNGIY